MTTTDNNSKYYPALTGIRCIAAYLVFLHHYQPFVGTWIAAYLSPINEFHAGVTFFFVLSGFLIANKYAAQPNLNFRSYFVKRVARIYPMYLLLTILTFAAAAEGTTDVVAYTPSFLANISLSKGYFDDFVFTGIVQGWSLTTEETFYIIAPLIFLLLTKRILLFWLSPIFLVASGILLIWLFQGDDFYGFMKSFDFMFSFTFFGRCVEFFSGISLYLVIKKFYQVNRLKIFTFIGIFMILLLLWFMHQLRGNHEFGVETTGGKFINNMLLPIFGIGIFYYGLLTEKTFIAKILSSGLMQLLGKSSYVFYLVHVGVVATLITKFTGNIFFLFVILNVLSILMFKFMEEPLNRFTRKVLQSKRPAIQQVAPEVS